MSGGGVCHIIGGGESFGPGFVKGPDDFVICADKGYTKLAEHSGARDAEPIAAPDLLIGDFDSLEDVPDDIPVIRLNKEKDDTDTFAAVQEGVSRGYTRFHFHCCTGGRIDHTLANIQLLAWLAKHKMQGCLYDGCNALTAVKDGAVLFAPCDSGYVSVFSLSNKSKGVNLRGLKYPLVEYTLKSTLPLGVSNEFTGKESSVSVKRGTLLIVYPNTASILRRCAFNPQRS